MASPLIERRKYQRVTLGRPIAGRVGSSRVFVLDASLDGLRLAHQGTIPVEGRHCTLSFEWDGRLIELECLVTRSSLQKLARNSSERSIYHAGLHIIEAIGDSAESLRAMIASLVARALDEQKANARGIPAQEAQTFQTGKGTEYLRCEMINGSWRRTVTTRPEQPVGGFTISAEEDRAHIDMLCATWEISSADERMLIQTMAGLSISKTEGIPTRRYEP